MSNIANKIYVNLNKITDLQEFVEIVSKIPGKVIAKSGDYLVDGKSILGLISLDLSRTIILILPTNITSEEKAMFNKFTV